MSSSDDLQSDSGLSDSGSSESGSPEANSPEANLSEANSPEANSSEVNSCETSVWSSIVGQSAAVNLLKQIAASKADKIAQSWLICGPAGSGRTEIARAFAAALECENHGCSQCDSCRHIANGTHADITIMKTDKVNIGIDEVRSLIEKSEHRPGILRWRIIIVEDFERMLERTTNVLLKEIEEPAIRTIWILCAPTASDVLPTIRSRCRIVNLTVPQAGAIAKYLREKHGTDAQTAERAARICEGNVENAVLYATNERACVDRDELVAQVLSMKKASDAFAVALRTVSSVQEEARESAAETVEREQAEFRRVNGLSEKDAIPSQLRSQWNRIGKAEDVKRLTNRRQRDIFERYFTEIAGIYRDVIIIANNAQDSAGLINREFEGQIRELAQRMTLSQAVKRAECVSVARRRLAGNVSPSLVFEALFCSLICF